MASNRSTAGETSPSVNPRYYKQSISTQQGDKSLVFLTCLLLSLFLLTGLGFHRSGVSNPNLTTAALSSLTNQSRSQLDTWREEPQSHERLAMGEDTLRAAEKVENFFKDVENSVEKTPK